MLSSTNSLHTPDAVVHPTRHDHAHQQDQLLRQLAEPRLRNSPYLGGHSVCMAIRSGTLTLTGSVDTFFQKQMAQESLRGLEGLLVIDNQLEVTS